MKFSVFFGFLLSFDVEFWIFVIVVASFGSLCSSFSCSLAVFLAKREFSFFFGIAGERHSHHVPAVGLEVGSDVTQGVLAILRKTSPFEHLHCQCCSSLLRSAFDLLSENFRFESSFPNISWLYLHSLLFRGWFHLVIYFFVCVQISDLNISNRL